MTDKTATQSNAIRWLSRNVFAIGMLSLFSDMGHELATAVLPLFLASFGGGAAVLGTIEGVSDAASSLVKLWMSHHSDRIGKRKPILIAGYQAEHTLGRRLVERRPEVRVLGQACPVKAEIVVLNGLSSHADHPELLRMIGPLAGTVQKVRLVHGEPARAEALAEGLRGIGFADVAIPDRGDQVLV